MEEIYVVKVKTRPEASQLYPSERRYSASTVGGLGLVHLLLGATTLLMVALGIAAEEGVASRYGGGVAMGVVACGAAIAAMLAWRRWYVDHNIRHFLIASAVAGVVSLVCVIVTSVSLAAVQEELSHQRLDTRANLNPTSSNTDGEVTVSTSNPTVGYNSEDVVVSTTTTFFNSDGTVVSVNPTSVAASSEGTVVSLNPTSVTTSSESTVANVNATHIMDMGENKVVSLNPTNANNSYKQDTSAESTFVRINLTYPRGEDTVVSPNPTNLNEPEVRPIITIGTHPVLVEFVNATNVHAASDVNITAEALVANEPSVDQREMSNVLLINILVASVLEFVWCALSVRIAWRGMSNDDEANNKQKKKNNTTGKRIVEGADIKVTALPTLRVGKRRPDLIANHLSSIQSNKYLNGRINVNGVGGNDMEHYLPKEESHVEYEERVRRFLASNNDG